MPSSELVDLASLVTTSTSSTVYPSSDSVVSVLQNRFRRDENYTRLGSTVLVAINPFRTLANLNEASADWYRKKCYEDVDWEQRAAINLDEALPPHPYEMALRVYHKMQRTRSSQAIVYSGASNSGKSFLLRLVTAQIIRVSCQANKQERRLGDQVRALETVSTAFGCCKTMQNGNASRFSRYFELHFTEEGRLAEAKLLTFGLEKARLCGPLAAGHRTYHVFYQLLAGASHEEKESLRLQDITSYSLLSSSGCYRLSGGPCSDDCMAMGELRAAMKLLGFKQRQVTAIFGLLSAILLLGNVDFVVPIVGGESREAARISNPLIRDDVAKMLGVAPDELEEALTTRSRLVRKEIISCHLSASAAREQRDALARDLYATLFAYVIETANHRLSSGSVGRADLTTQIVQFDPVGFQEKTEAQGDSGVSALGHYEFASNFVAETTQDWLLRRMLDDTSVCNRAAIEDGVKLPDAVLEETLDCVQLLRGDVKIGEGTSCDRKPSGLLGSIDRVVQRVRAGKMAEDDEEGLLSELRRYEHHNSYITFPASAPRRGFTITHYAGNCSYRAHSFLPQEQDVFDANFVQLLRASQVPFLAKLFAGPTLATESHPLDPDVVVGAQVSVRPLRQPSPLDPSLSALDPLLNPHKPYGVTRQLNSCLAEIICVLEGANTIWNVLAIRPNDIDLANAFDSGQVKSQVQALSIPALAAKKRYEYVASFSFDDFCRRYAGQGLDHAGMAVGVSGSREKVQAFVIANAWRDSSDCALGETKIWISYTPWRRLEDRKRASEPRQSWTRGDISSRELSDAEEPRYPPSPKNADDLGHGENPRESEGLLRGHRTSISSNPFVPPGEHTSCAAVAGAGWTDDWDTKAGAYGTPANDAGLNSVTVREKDDRIRGEQRAIDSLDEESTTATRVWWLRITWFCTWWIPTVFLSKCGKMKRPDVQLAWREKVTICMMILFSCISILFYIVALGKILCPDNSRAWNKSQLSGHNSANSFYVAVRGKVYDISKFWKLQHSDTAVQATPDAMMQLAGLDLTPYFPIPLTTGCPRLVTSDQLALQTNSSSTDYTPTITQAIHTSGALTTDKVSRLADVNWYPDRFLPYMDKFHKGSYVTSKKDIAKQASDRQWAIVDDKLYDLSNYVWTLSLYSNDNAYKFLPDTVYQLFAAQPGQDISSDFHNAMLTLNATYRAQTQNCLDNVFYAGKVDFRDSPRCQVQNYMLLAFSILIMTTILAKFLAALQLTPKRNPEQQDKFVICQVPCYTEGEEELRKTIDSLACLQYDDKRKLLFLICDGMIVGSGNELPTPRIVLDILGVDAKMESEPLMFKSVAEGAKQLNYGKVYSGLYEFEGHVVPYVVVVKVGRPSERSRPGNRGKRDSQILLMRYLNRVHFDAPMYPLELEIYHQMKNVIGIDPAFYEYILTIDADTTVEPEGLNRLVAVAADDSSVIALCGETKLDNEEASWWTMIQVYEYYISHHMAKAFESLFGSVTCLPGCFSMYRIRSADKGKPLLISNRIIDAYSENKVDTLHKKNLLSLGEDRFLTTLILKNFPSFRTKFSPDARAHTSAPDQWGVLLSQRRRWINSTIHNLAELVLMPELCGFCLFSMRFVVFIDLIGTIILPATVVYLVYLIVIVATGNSPIPYISIALIAAVYGLQAIIFLLKRQWQYIGWLLIYIVAYPVWSFFLPIYSFWHMDDFSWGNTRIVVGEKGRKKIVAGTDEEPYDDSMIPLMRYSEYQREVWKQPDTPSVRSGTTSLASTRGPFGNQNAVAGKTYASSYYAGSASGSEFGGGGDGGDYYQNTNVLSKKSGTHSRPGSTQNLLGMSANFNGPQMTRLPSGGYHQPSMYGMPSNSAASMYGMPMATNSFLGMSNPSMYGMPNSAVQAPPSIFGVPSISGLEGEGYRYVAPQSTGGSWAAPAFMARQSVSSAFAGNSSFATGLAAAPSNNLPINLKEDPTDEDLTRAVRNFLAVQPDLMQVSRRNVREAVIASFPNGRDLRERIATLNKAIEGTLAGATS